MYDYWLGGKDNFAADREVGDRLMGIGPEMVSVVRENRKLLATAVSWAAGQGISQFIDLGCGLPTEPSTHDSARAIEPDARIAYVDNDPVVISHLSALLAKDPAAAVIDSDVADSGAVLAAAGKLLDLSRPACLIMCAVMHFFGEDAARDLIARYVAALAPGSYLVLTVGGGPPGPESDRFVATYSSGPHPLYIHEPDVLVSFLKGLEVLPPGVADARVWRPGWETVPAPEPRGLWMNSVMARVPG